MSTTQISDRQTVLQNLNPCSTYWVVVSAVNCGLRIASEARLINLYESTPFNITFCPGENFGCNDWITVDLMNKIGDVETALNSVLTTQCLAASLPCYLGSRFSCNVDSSVVTFE